MPGRWPISALLSGWTTTTALWEASARAGVESILAPLQEEGCQTDSQARPEAVTLPDSDNLYYHMLAGVMGGELPEAILEKLQHTALSDAYDYCSRLARGATQSHAEWLKRDEERAQLQAHWTDFFQHYDLMICPVTNTPLPHDQSQPVTERRLNINGHSQPYMSITVWAGLASIAGLPALTIPISPEKDGTPRGHSGYCTSLARAASDPVCTPAGRPHSPRWVALARTNGLRLKYESRAT